MVRSVLPVLLVLGVTAGVGTAQVQTVVGQPDLTVVAADDEFTWGEHRELTLSVVNSGQVVDGGPPELEERVTTARNVDIALARDRLSPALARAVTVSRDRAVLGSVQAGNVEDATFDVAVGQQIEPGVYELPLVVSYEFSTIAELNGDTIETNRQERARVVRVPIRIVDRPRIEVSPAEDQSLVPGIAQPFQITVRNTGTEPASKLGITLTTDNVTAQFGSDLHAGSEAGLYFETLEPGEEHQRTLTVRVPPRTATGSYLVTGSAQYRRPGGFEAQTSTLRFGISVRGVNESRTTSGPSNTRAFPETYPHLR